MIKKELLRFTLSAIIIYLTSSTLNPAVAITQPLEGHETHFCGVSDYHPLWRQHSKRQDNRNYARRFAANLNVGEPRTVRMIYFLPNDRRYQAEVVQQMKEDILKVQTFFADQMEAYGYGRATFRVETDSQGEPMVHPVVGRHPDSHYPYEIEPVVNEISLAFDFNTNIYLVVVDHRDYLVGSRYGKQGGFAFSVEGYPENVAHELGHAFGLAHDFRDGRYIMSYGSGTTGAHDLSVLRLSACHAEYLSVHPYFNGDTPIEEAPRPTIELISPRTYPSGLQGVSVRLKISHSVELHQAILHAAQPDNRWSVKSCRGFSGERSTIIEFDYNGVIPAAHDLVYGGSTSLLNPLVHRIAVEAIDMDGNVGYTDFVLFPETLDPLRKISGDNQHGLPNTPLPVPFVVEVRDLDSGYPVSGIPITFRVTAGGGRLSVNHTQTGYDGRAQSTLTLGPSLGTNTVFVSAAEIDQPLSFNALAGAPVDIPDSNLRAAIENNLGKVPSTPIAPADMIALPILHAESVKIIDLTGLEHATNMDRLYLFNNSISDLSVLGGLTNLTWLFLGENSISDLSVLGSLINLTVLYLGNNSISDISALVGLTNLTELSLEDNTITDISPVAGLTRLTQLNLSNNAISDVSPLLGLNLIGLWDSIGLYIEGNPLSYASINTHIPAMQAKGVEVKFDNRTPTTLLNISGVITELDNLLIVEVRDSKNLAFAGVPVTFTVTSGGGTLSITHTTTDTNGRAQSRFTLGSDEGTSTVRASVAGISESVTFSDVQANIPDPNLRAAIETALKVAPNTPIAPAEIASMTRLEARNASISDLTGLEHATNLTYLDLGFVDAEGRRINSNSISNLSPLVGLMQLTYLNLWGNSISDISPLAGLTKLTQLELSNNSISDISSVAGLTNLTYLDLDGNSISDISGVSELTNLTRLELGSSNLSDLSPLANLTNLTILWLYGNNISNLSPLVANMGLGSGDKVYVRSNPLSYASIRDHIPTLQSRGVTVDSENRAHSALLKISGDNQKGASFAALSQPFVVEAQDANGAALARISVTFAVTAGGGTLSTTITRTGRNGRAQSTLTLGPNLGTNTVQVSATGIKAPVTFHAISDTEAPSIAADVNNDGSVNILDLVSVSSKVGSAGANLAADVNGDGVVNILDLVIVAGMFDGAAAAPASQLQVPTTLTAVEVQDWLTDARSLEIRDPIMKRGFLVLEQLLAALTPTETELLANYPNPFNPETWMPYRLAEDAFVTLTIYDRAGQVVRTLDVGHRIASAYENQSKAIYWDGRNGLGEPVASGVYFYTLTAGDYSATRRMMVLK